MNEEREEALDNIKNTTEENANETEDELILALKHRVYIVKNDPEVRWAYMTIGHKIREAYEDGREEGRQETERIFRALLGNPQATNSEISAITGDNDERINVIRNIINQSKV